MTDPLPFTDDPDYTTPEADALVRDILSKLPLNEAERFQAAINRIRKEAGRGKVRLREPSEQEERILTAYEKAVETPTQTRLRIAEKATGEPYWRVAYVTRKFGVRLPSQRRWRYPSTPEVLAFIRESHAKKMTLTSVAEEIGRYYGNRPHMSAMERLAAEAGVVFQPRKFDLSRGDELVGDIITLEQKYGVSIGTLELHFYAITEEDRKKGKRR